MNASPMNRPTAWLPVAMSLAAFLLVVGHAVTVGIVHEADEGTAAHVFQLLMAGQVPLVAYFALKWLPRVPRTTLRVLAVQAGAALAAIAAVYRLT
jgi:hypothetical protein